MASAAAAGGVVYVLAGMSAASRRPDRVHAVRAAGASIAWSAPYGIADVSPTVADGLVFVEDAQTTRGPPDRDAFDNVQALDAATGRLRWSYESGLGSFSDVGTNEEAVAAMVDRGVLFQSLPSARRFAAFDARSGRLLWSIPTAGPVKMSAIAAGGRLYVADTSGVLYTLSEGTGRVLRRRRFAAPFTCSSPVLAGATLYIANDTTLRAISAGGR